MPSGGRNVKSTSDWKYLFYDMSNEVPVISRKCVLLEGRSVLHSEVKQHEFRCRFKNEIISNSDADGPYKHLDKSSVKDWMKTPWNQINVEQMDMELRRFSKVNY
ncbi:hypothetical protein XELAEV_18047178mg [Xenopus laevis]|uniref:Uncharacterized protein n=1 Tax=Xenopus laevis TaxID=8355 RepID=A0A974H1N9_XENLA|nr:hypothetical protein XELAEV_18047178mg [Xenopus laevis]